MVKMRMMGRCIAIGSFACVDDVILDILSLDPMVMSSSPPPERI